MMLPSLVFFLLRTFATQCEVIKAPTLKPVDNFSADIDAAVLKKEIQDGSVTNRDKLVKFWFHRTFDERKQIEAFYNTHFCRDSDDKDQCPLDADFHWISDHSLDDLYSDSLLPPEMILGETVHEVITDKWKEKGAIEIILCAEDKEMKDRVAKFYQSTYKQPLENHLATFHTEDKDYQHVMQQYCWKGLCQEKKIKPDDADKEAQALRAIDPDKDTEGFKKKLNELLDKNSEPDMKFIFEKYRNDKYNIVNSVEKAFADSECVEMAYNRLVRYIENTCQCYADELYNAMDGCGTDYDNINRIVLTRCERDLACISKKYEETHKQTFTNRFGIRQSIDTYNLFDISAVGKNVVLKRTMSATSAQNITSKSKYSKKSSRI